MEKLAKKVGSNFLNEITARGLFIKINQELGFHERLRELFQIGDYFHVLFNLKNTNIEFCSDGIARVLGYEPSGFSRHELLDSIHPEDLPIFLKHENKVAEFYSRLSSVKIPKYKLCFDFRVRNNFGVYKRLMRQVVHIGMDDGGIPVRLFSIYTDISYLKKNTTIRLSILGLKGEPSYSEVISDSFGSKLDNPFSERELQVLKLLGAGESVTQIAAKLNLSESTINNHRYNMLLKAGVKSSPGLVGKAIRNGWIE